VLFEHDSPNDLATFDGLQSTDMIERAGGDSAAATVALQRLRFAEVKLHLALGNEAAQSAHRHLSD